ncbi:hypothetical protein [Sphingomicrobium lutaoense]|uniref:Uncharacterized protein n=1 Tax=Sphingomicrobium lutaoense TaxID=515949 RepID=A0A839YYD3_9SPHN|nr:hypothetical protein [Sphingomicrobium lutaoense]MBB3763490.1 hypothetical protein [Sphingomicrobium lutaoense]
MMIKAMTSLAIAALAFTATSADAQVRAKLFSRDSLAAAVTPYAAEARHGGWQIGPIARGRNYSLGMPLYARDFGHGGFTFDFPYASARAGHVHYVTRPVRTLAGASIIRVRYQVEASPGTRFIPQEDSHRPATVSLYFQRAGDNWSGRGRFAAYRWYAPPAEVRQIKPGQFEMRVRLDDPAWVGVTGGITAGNNPTAYRAALRHAGRIGLVFGSAGLRGHGVFATAPARFTVTDFSIR